MSSRVLEYDGRILQGKCTRVLKTMVLMVLIMVITMLIMEVVLLFYTSCGPSRCKCDIIAGTLAPPP